MTGHGKGWTQLGVVCMALGAFGCEELWYGTGAVFVWNQAPAVASVEVSGRSPSSFEVRQGQSKHFPQVVAGTYNVRVRVAGLEESEYQVEVPKDKLALINVARASCFARAEVVGMYMKNRAPVELVETYADQDIFVLPNVIAVFPGQTLPANKPGGAHMFQRLAVVPCGYVAQQGDERRPDEVKLKNYLRRLR